MKKLYSAYRAILLLFISVSFSHSILAQAPGITWQKCLGGTDVDRCFSTEVAVGGGYFIAGYTLSTDGDITTYHGSEDFWVVKLNEDGSIKWQKNIGNTTSEMLSRLKATPDGGCIVIGMTSGGGDFPAQIGGADIGVVKLDSSGNISWSKVYGSSFLDNGSDIALTTDGGYILCANVGKADGDVTKFYGGGQDYWVAKLTSSGSISWQKSYGGSQSDIPSKIIQTNDGGYLVSGNTQSNDSMVSGNHGGTDIWLVKTNDTGGVNWKKTLGGTGNDAIISITQTTDSGYILIGATTSSNGDITMNHGINSNDIWVIKFDKAGAIIWQKTYGGSGSETGRGILQTSDGGYIFAGSAASADGDVTDHKGTASISADVWIVKINASGVIGWSKSYGGLNSEDAVNISFTSDGGYFFGGNTFSNDGDVSGNHGATGKQDFWAVKLGGGLSVEPLAGKNNNIKVYPTITNDIVNIDLPPGYEKATMRIVNTLGQEIPFTQNGVGMKKTIRIDNVPAAMYILYITNEGNTSSFKISYQQ